jgi:hypothetical protein
MSIASTIAIAGGALSLVGNVLTFVYGGAVAPKHDVQDFIACAAPDPIALATLRQAKVWGWIGFVTTGVGGAIAIIASAIGA